MSITVVVSLFWLLIALVLAAIFVYLVPFTPALAFIVVARAFGYTGRLIDGHLGGIGYSLLGAENYFVALASLYIEMIWPSYSQLPFLTDDDAKNDLRIDESKDYLRR